MTHDPMIKVFQAFQFFNAFLDRLRSKFLVLFVFYYTQRKDYSYHYFFIDDHFGNNSMDNAIRQFEHFRKGSQRNRVVNIGICE